MWRRALIGAMAIVAVASQPALAGRGLPRSIEDRTRAAERVIVARVAATEARYQTNEFGDRLIVTRATLVVEEALKGQGASTVEVEVEGGTVGGITLRVSDLPSIAPGERGVFFLARNRAGRLVPHLREQSILKLDAQDRVRGTLERLAEIRARVRAAREAEGRR